MWRNNLDVIAESWSGGIHSLFKTDRFMLIGNRDVLEPASGDQCTANRARIKLALHEVT